MPQQRSFPHFLPAQPEPIAAVIADFKVPDVPPEIIAEILSYLCIQQEAVTIRPTRKHIEEEAEFNERESRQPVKTGQRPFRPLATKLPALPPTQSHKAPSVNLLLVSKLFYKDCIKQF
jgi:hypothetical protein